MVHKGPSTLSWKLVLKVKGLSSRCTYSRPRCRLRYLLTFAMATYLQYVTPGGGRWSYCSLFRNWAERDLHPLIPTIATHHPLSLSFNSSFNKTSSKRIAKSLFCQIWIFAIRTAAFFFQNFNGKKFKANFGITRIFRRQIFSKILNYY